MINPLTNDLIISLTRLVEVKDHCTAAHTWRVSLYTQALCEAMAMEQPVVYRMMRAAALHDLGKLDIPSHILSKPGRLSDEEFAIIKTHPALGYERLVRMGETDELVLALVRSHHERIDGTGYPDGLKGEAVPLPARLFAVIDTFDAMTSIRSYRRALGEEAAKCAMQEIRAKAGAWYCPDAVEEFGRLQESGSLRWIQEHYNDQASLDGIGLPRLVEVITRTAERVTPTKAGVQT